MIEAANGYIFEHQKVVSGKYENNNDAKQNINLVIKGTLFHNYLQNVIYSL